MLVVNRNTYNIEEYKRCREIEVNPIQFYIIDLLQGGHEVHVGQLIKWIKLKANKDITPNGVYMQMRRLKERGIEFKYKNGYYQLEEKEVWLV